MAAHWPVTTLKTKQKVWSVDLVTPQMVDNVLKQQDAESTEMQHKYGHASGDATGDSCFCGKNMPDSGFGRKRMAPVRLQGKTFGAGQKGMDTLTHYDWNSGKVSCKTVVLTNESFRFKGT